MRDALIDVGHAAAAVWSLLVMAGGPNCHVVARQPRAHHPDTWDVAIGLSPSFLAVLCQSAMDYDREIRLNTPIAPAAPLLVSNPS